MCLETTVQFCRSDPALYLLRIEKASPAMGRTLVYLCSRLLLTWKWPEVIMCSTHVYWGNIIISFSSACPLHQY